MRIVISEIEVDLPGKPLTNDEFKRENPDWDLPAIEARTGVKQRHVAQGGQTALDLAEAACLKLFSRRAEIRGKIDALLFCTESGDYILPPNACVLHKRIGLEEGVAAFDFNLACSGYPYGLLISEGLIKSGRAKGVLLINADTYSSYINAKDRSARVLFGDGAAVSFIEMSANEQGVIDLMVATSGEHYAKFIIPAGGRRLPHSEATKKELADRSGNIRSAENIKMDGLGIMSFMNSKIPVQVGRLLERNSLSVGDIDLFIFHQASKTVLDSLVRIMKINEERVFRNLEEVGNTVSASIPIALKSALDQGKIREGYRVLLCGFGAGLSWGTALVQY